MRTQIEPPVKSPSFNQNNVSLNLQLLSKETSPKVYLPDGNASQEMYIKTQNSMKMGASATARPHSTLKMSSDMMIKNETRSDERSVTTVSASFLHNI